MKKTVLFPVLMLLLGLMVSCNETQIKLKGLWQLKTIYWSDGTSVNQDSVFYSFQKNVFQYTHLERVDSTYRYPGRYYLVGDSLFIVMDDFDIYRGEFGESDSLKIGFKEKHFYIGELTGNWLELRAGDGVYSLRKF
ncbi:MAG: lipocalin-like domain-containing protein [Candidatus Azobacteroides sp.]|nr:lipocalin-like domain-containing protein [Candidatus Azobacteroides sp.]